MKININSTDRILRLLFAVVVAILYFTHVISGISGIMLGAVGMVLAATAVINFCPIYFALGWSTNKPKKQTV